MGSNGQYADTTAGLKRLAGRSLLAVGSGLAKGAGLVATAAARGVSALTSDAGDREAVLSLKFALAEWTDDAGAGDGAAVASGAPPALRRLPVLLVGLDSGFQVWRLDGSNPVELLSRRDGPVRLLEAVPEPRAGEGKTEGWGDELRGDRPLLAVVPEPERPSAGPAPPPPPPPPGAAAPPQQQAAAARQHSVQLYSLRSHGYVRSLSFSGEVLGVAASPRLLVVALRGQVQAFDARSLQHTFSCLTYTPPQPQPQPAGRQRMAQQQQQQQFVVAGLTGGGGDAAAQQQQQQQQASAAPPAAVLAPFALGPRWLAYSMDTPVPQSAGQAVAQRLPLGRQDSSSASGRTSALGGGGPDSDPSGGGLLGGSPACGNGGLTTTAVADAALAAAAKGGQQLRAGLGVVGSAGIKLLSQQYASWRAGGQQLAQRDLDALEADAAVAGTVLVRDVITRAVVAHFRAHTSPLATLQFSPGGTLLATASVAGHSINVFSVVPPPAVGGGGDGLGGGGGGGSVAAGHAVWLYRLYRGVTPAAIRGIAFAPDAAWVAVSSGRGTTHLFHTPAAAPGARPHEQQLQGGGGGGAAGEAGVVGRPPKLPAAGRARKSGLLNGGVAGAATSAARNLYSGQPAGAAPIAAAFLAAGPSSPHGSGDGAPESGDPSPNSVYVVTHDGLLTRHLLRVPPADDAGGGGATAPSSPRGAAGQLERQDSSAAGGAAAPAALEEADRWDVARHASWPEREELLPGVGAAGTACAAAPASHAGDPSSGGGGDAAQQQLWVAQAEAGALVAPRSGAEAPLWADPQFRFYELQVAQLARKRSAAGGSDAGGGGMAEAAPAPAGGEEAPWLEHIPARPVQQQQ